MLPGVFFEVGSKVTGKVALCAFVRLLLGVNEGVSLQMAILTKGLVALFANVLVNSTVDHLVVAEPASVCKCLWANVTK